MKVRSANFVTSCADPKAADSYSPQIAVAGRSNCGKSSLLNMLMGARLCKTSQTPGRTRLINVFRVNADAPFYFIDLPGYGFNAAQRVTSDELNARTDAYFRGNDNIAQVLCLMDVRRDPSDLDKVLINYLRDLCLPFTVVITKADKLSKAQLGNAKLRIAAALGLARDDLIATSSSKNIGWDALLDRLQNVLEVFGSDTENGDAHNDDEQ